MKRIIGLLSVLVALTSFGQERQPVYSITMEKQSLDWYETQAKLWKKETESNPKNAEAWYYLFAAHRALKHCSDTQEERDAHNKASGEVAKKAYKELPNSFEANHLMYCYSDLGGEKKEFLFRAHEIAPEDTRAYADLMIEYDFARDKENFNAIAKKIFERNVFPQLLLNWAYNALSELDENAIVFSAGDNDTYAFWVVQGAMGFRRDVTVVNTHMIRVDDYRTKMTKELGLTDFKLDKDLSNLNDLYLHFINNTKEIPGYVAMTAFHEFYVDGIKDSLYLNGLTFRYSTNEIDNTSIIRRNYEKRYLLDYLKQSFNNVGLYKHLDDAMAGMYLASMIKLCNHYKTTEEEAKLEELKPLLRSISEKVNREEDVKQLLED